MLQSILSLKISAYLKNKITRDLECGWLTQLGITDCLHETDDFAFYSEM